MLEYQTTSERIDDLPWLIHWLKQMRVDVIIDTVLGPPHGNWDGLSYGELGLLFIAYVVTGCTHFLSPMQDWTRTHCISLSQALGKPVREQDCTDDRLAVLLSHLGDEPSAPGAAIELALGQHLIRAYALPTDTARIDMTSVSVHHVPTEPDGLMQYGHSKDHRPDLRQFKEVLGTLDPVGLPVATACVSGEQADDPHYVPIWERLVTVIGRTDFLVVGDCKLASLANRAHIQRRGGCYRSPLPMTGQTPAELRAWVLTPPSRCQSIRLPDQAPSAAAVGRGLVVAVACQWDDPDTAERVCWSERRLVVQSTRYAQQQRTGLRARLQKAESALRALNRKPAAEPLKLEASTRAILKRYEVGDYLLLQFAAHVSRTTGYIGRGRPGPNRPMQSVETQTWTVSSQRDHAAIQTFDRLAGWRVYATNTPGTRLSLAGAVNCYRQEWQPEHGFHRLKGGLLAIMPLYVRDDNRIRGLRVLLAIALRVLTLTEFVVRRNLATTDQALPGLYAGSPRRATSQPTAERLLQAFDNLTLYRHASATDIWYEVTALSPLQQRILQLLGIPESVYAPPSPVIHSG